MSTARASSRPDRALAMLGPRRSDGRTAAVVGAHFVVVFAPIWVAAWAGPRWWTVVCWLWFGMLAHGFHLVLHELIHKLLFQRSAWNEGLAYRVVAPLFLLDFEAFRRRHWAHHRELGTDADPKYTYRIDVQGMRFVRLALSMLAVMEPLRRFAFQAGEHGEGSTASRRRTLGATALVQTLLVASIVAVARLGHPNDWTATAVSSAVAYGFVYLYGLAGLAVWFTTLRGIAEHRRADETDVVHRDAALRNFTHGLVDRLLFGTYGFADHATHHRHPSVSCAQLPALTRMLAAEDPTLIPVGSHMAILARLVRQRRTVAAAPDRLPAA